MNLSIDLGTCFSKAAFVLDGKITCVKDPGAQTSLYPSSAYVDTQNRIWAGQRAEAHLLIDPLHCYRYFKKDIAHNKPYTLLGANIYPGTLIAALLWHIKQDAEQMLGSPATNAFITIPKSYKVQKFQSEILQSAGRNAQFNHIELIEDAVATAIYYDEKQNMADKERVLVYDMGGTFDATIVQKKGRYYEVVNYAKSPEQCGGGIAFDTRIYEDLVQHIQRTQPHLSPWLDTRNTAPDALRLRRTIRNCCIRFKHQLSMVSEIDENIEPGVLNAHSISYILTRSEFETMINPFLEETFSYCDYVVRDAGLSWQDIAHVLLVGGSCHIPCIKERMQQKWRRSVTLLADLETATCQGGALYAHQRIASKPDLLAVLAKWTQDFLKENERSQTPVVAVMRYADAISYFVRERPANLHIQKGAILRQAYSQGHIVTQVFLDENSTIVYDVDGKPYGRQLIVRRFDRELQNVFADQQLIIVE